MSIQFLFEELLVESAVISVKQRVYASSMQKYYEIITMKNYIEGEGLRGLGINTKLCGRSDGLNDISEAYPDQYFAAFVLFYSIYILINPRNSCIERHYEKWKKEKSTLLSTSAK